MSFLDDVEKYFFTRCLYDVLGVSKDANDEQLRKAYYLRSLKHHPDRSTDSDNEECKSKFQVISRVYDTLSNPEKRAIYDKLGELFDERETVTFGRNWGDYWNLLFKKITVEDIENFEKEYKGSNKEEEDIKHLYFKHKGNMDNIMESILCINFDEEDRVRSIIRKYIDNGEVPNFFAFSKEPKLKRNKRMKAGQKEKLEAEQRAKVINIATNNSLDELIPQGQDFRVERWNIFFDDTEEIYSKKKRDTNVRRYKVKIGKHGGKRGISNESRFSFWS